MNRLYVIESTLTITGANADHRFLLEPTEMLTFVNRAVSGKVFDNWPNPPASLVEAWGPLARDLERVKGISLVIAGDEQPASVHALAHIFNDSLGNVGKTVFYTDPIEANSVDQTQSLRELVGDIDAGKVDTLIIMGGNPAYNTPIDLRLDLSRLSKVKLRAHLSLYNNDTSYICHWHLPATHYLESWSDTRSYDGTVTIVQPLIAPLYEGRTAHELLTLFSDNYDRKPYDIVKDYWRNTGVRSQESEVSTGSGSERVQDAGRIPADRSQDAGATTDFESWWRKCLHDGFVPNTALPTKTFSLKSDWASSLSSNTQPPKPNTLELVFRPDPSIYDGRFANNGWLQELPKPLTKLTWDNVAIVSPTTAHNLGLSFPNYDKDKKGGEAFV